MRYWRKQSGSGIRTMIRIGLKSFRHLSTSNISSKSMHTFLSNLANRQTDKQTRAKTCTSSFVSGNDNKHQVQKYNKRLTCNGTGMTLITKNIQNMILTHQSITNTSSAQVSRHLQAWVPNRYMSTV